MFREQILKSILSSWRFIDLFLWFFNYIIIWALQNHLFRDNASISCLKWLLYFLWRFFIKTLLFYFTFRATARYTFNIIQFRAVIDQDDRVLSRTRLLVKFRFFFIKFIFILSLILLLRFLKLCVAALRNIHQIRLLPLLSDEVLNMLEQLILRLFKSTILLTMATFLVCIVFFKRETLEHIIWGVVNSINS